MKSAHTPWPNSTAFFGRSFSLDAQTDRARLRLRAFRHFEVKLNGQSVAASSPERSWKTESEIDVAKWLHPGENQMVLRVENRDGPPALWLVLELPTGSLSTDTRWEAFWAGATWKPARPASEPLRDHRFDPDRSIKLPLAALAARWPTLLGLMALAGALVGLTRCLKRCRRGACLTASTTTCVALLAALLWAALFLNNSRWLDPVVGFDAKYHLAYVQYILDQGALPSADQGWQTYQPPPYYLLAAAVLKLAGLSTTNAGAALALRLLGLACGLCNIFLVAACMRRLFPQNERRQVLGVLVAAFLPCQLYLFQFPTNEMLLVTLSSGTLLAGLRLLDEDAPALSRYLLLGACLGLALLAKVSALLLAMALFAVLALHVARRPRPVLARSLAKLAAAVLTTLLVCGWHYARVWARFGNPLVGNWDTTLGMNWWQDPGYRTLHDCLRFGRVLVAPMFAGFGGIPDGLYSSLWGDGLGSGFSNVGSAPPWSYDLMSLGYLLALVPTAALLAGGLASLVAWARQPNLVGTLLGSFAFLVLAGIVFMSLRVASFAQVKASYGLAGLVPLCVCAAVGLDLAVFRRGWRAPLVHTAVGTWALLAFLAFWINGASAPALTARGMRAIAGGQREAGAAFLGQAVARDPHGWSARLALARLLIENQAPSELVNRRLEIDHGRPDLASRHLLLASAFRRQGQSDEALAEARRGIALDPDSAMLQALVADLLASRGDLQAAEAAWREVLRITPQARTAHESLARLLDRLGQNEDASVHRTYAARLPSRRGGVPQRRGQRRSPPDPARRRAHLRHPRQRQAPVPGNLRARALLRRHGLSRSQPALGTADTDLYIISRDRFDEVVRAQPLVGIKIFARLARVLANRLRHTDAELRALQDA